MGFILPGANGVNFRPAPGSTGGGAAPSAPVIISPLTANGTVGTAFSYWITAVGSPLSYNATGLPAGLTVNTGTGQISGIPTTAAAGTNVTISATNTLGTDTQTLVVTIAAARPVVTGGTLSGVAGTAITPFQISATNSPTSYAVNPALPAGLSLNTTTGEITGTPAAAINTSVQVTATNAVGTSNPATLAINIAAAAIAPVITAGQTISGTAGTAITAYTVQRTTAGTPPVTWSATGLPSALTINASTGVISGTPATATGSPFTANITATNATGSDTKPLTVTVAAPSLMPVITSALAVSFAPNAAVSYTISATNTPTSFNATGLPAWLTRTGAVISGTAPPTVSTNNIQISATNASGTDTKTLVLTISEGWEITNQYTGAVIATSTSKTQFGPVTNWVGWQPAFQADFGVPPNYIYDWPTPAAQTIRMYSHFSPYTAGTETEVPFDNWTNPPVTGNAIQEWGYDPGDNTVYISGGQNGTGNPIRFKLIKS